MEIPFAPKPLRGGELHGREPGGGRQGRHPPGRLHQDAVEVQGVLRIDDSRWTETEDPSGSRLEVAILPRRTPHSVKSGLSTIPVRLTDFMNPS